MARSTLLRVFAAPMLALCAAVLSTTGCQILLGIGGELPLEEGGSGGTGAASTGGAGGDSTTAGAGGAPSTGGLGGTGGGIGGTGGGGGAGLGEPCTPGEVGICYSGPPGTADVGICKSVPTVCNHGGEWEPCGHGEVLPEAESCAAPEDEDCNGADCVLWMRAFVGEAFGTGIGIDAQGNIVATLTFKEPIDFGDGEPVVPNGNSDVAILKFDKSGKLLWKKTPVSPGQQSIRDLDVSPSGDIVIGGDTYGNMNLGGAAGTIGGGAFVAKLDPDGYALWARTAQTTDGIGAVEFVAQDSMGNVIAAGNEPDIDFGTGKLTGPDTLAFYLASLDGATGQPQWVKLAQAEGRQKLGGLSVGPSDDIVLLGTLESQHLGLGPDNFNSCCGERPFVARLPPDGSYVDGEVFAGGMGVELKLDPNGLVVDSQGVATTCGTFEKMVNFDSGKYDVGMWRTAFVVHEATPSTLQWSRAYLGEMAVSEGRHLALDGEDNIVVVGTYGGPVDFGNGIPPDSENQYVLKLDKNGNVKWLQTFFFGDGSIQGVAGGTLENETAVIGTFFGGVDLGLTTGEVDATQGVFILRMAD